MRPKLTLMVIFVVLSGFTFLIPESDNTPHLPSYDNRMKEDHAPTPFTSKEIAQACSTGLEMKYKVEQKGKSTVYQITWFTNTDFKGSDFEVTTTDLDGNVLDEKQAYATWQSLQSHASFPEKDCVITLETIKLDSGKFNCWLYTVKGKNEVSKFWFARNLPGPPVLYKQFKNGKRTFRMTLVRNSYLNSLETDGN